MAATLPLVNSPIGTAGMLGGQMADIQAEGRDVSRDEIVDIHRRKTGALIVASLRLGGVPVLGYDV